MVKYNIKTDTLGMDNEGFARLNETLTSLSVLSGQAFASILGTICGRAFYGAQFGGDIVSAHDGAGKALTLQLK